MIKITQSVGKDGRNIFADVKLVQILLVANAQYLGPLRPVSISGKLDEQTVFAIQTFQRNVVGMINPDGRVDPGGKTLGKLANPGSGPYFPFPSVPALGWKTPPRSYGARRSGGARAHAGCDLYFPVGTWIYAVADGELVANPRAFYRGTDQMSIYHPSLDCTLRYGEIKSGSGGRKKKGSKVLAGQRIAKVGKMTGLTISMLHLEVYKGKVLPRLDTSAGAKKLSVNGKMVSTKRLATLVDPTPYLDNWKSNLPNAYS